MNPFPFETSTRVVLGGQVEAILSSKKSKIDQKRTIYTLLRKET